MFIKSNDVEELDKEWIALMQMARKMGISLEEIREFLSFNSNCLWIYHE
jgi:DNA-binding transcriptional MerR regulator